MSTMLHSGAAPSGAAAGGAPAPPRTVLAGLSAPALAAAVFSLSAGLVHFVYVPDHWWIWVPYGLFFLGTGLLQTTLAALLVARKVGPWIASAAIAMNLAIVCIYAISRTQYGALIGPMRGHAELPRLVDMATTAGELVTVVALLSFLPRRVGRWVTTLLCLAGAYLWWLRITHRLAY
jgi:hypothetical protein